MSLIPRRLLHVLPFVLAAGLYLPLVWNHYYVWDDWILFVDDPSLRDPSTLWQRAFEPVLWGSSYIRPLVMASFGAEMLVFGNDPRWPHVINALLHGVNVLLVGVVALGLHPQRERGPALPAMLAASVYAIHPSLVESVAWISGRFDLMTTTFSLAALAALLHGRGGWRDAGFAVGFALALLCKEMAITLPALAVLLLVWRAPADLPLAARLRALMGRAFWHNWRRLAVLTLLVVAAYFALRWSVLGALLKPAGTINSQLEWADRLALSGWATLHYLRATWLPFFGGSPVSPVVAGDFSSMQRLTGLAALLLTGAAAALLLLRWPRHALSLALGGWLLALLPVLHLIALPINANLGHDRFLTLPLALWALALTRLLQPLPPPSLRWSRMLGVPLLLWSAGAILQVRATIPLWANDLALWSWAHQKSPDTPEVRNNLLAAANRFGNAEVGRQLVDTRLPTDYSEFTLNAALFKLRSNDAPAALRLLQSLERELGSPHADRSQPESYLDSFRAPQKSLRVLDGLYAVLAEVYFHMGDFGMAQRMARIALLYRPDGPKAHEFRALALYGLRRIEEADAAYVQAQRFATKGGQGKLEATRRTFMAAQCASIPADDVLCRHLARILKAE